jgi:putative NADPH-quinone reductase
MRTLLVHCHPNPHSYNAALAQTAREALQAAGHEVDWLDLYAEGFDPVMSCQERIDYMADAPASIRKLQAQVDRLKAAEHLVFVHPTWWYGPPSLLKGWLERVWLPGVAFVPPSRPGQVTKPLLQHIRRLTVVTTGGAPWWWLKVIGDPHKKLFTRGLRVLLHKSCRVTWLQLHEMNTVSAEKRSRFLSRVRQCLQEMRDV